MAEELDKKLAEAEERLAKATEAYKTLKAENAELKKQLEAKLNIENVDAYVKRIKELEDEITINGNSSEEIRTLTERIEKAKEIFKEQKERIAELEGTVTKWQNEANAATDKLTEATQKLQGIREILG